MSFPRPRVPSALILLVGLAFGWGLASFRPPALRATGADRSGESILTTGPVQVQHNDGLKIQLAQDAIYYLDYKSGRLLGTIPSYKQVAGEAQYLGSFVERDLVADFKIDIDHGPRPRFLMTTGALGIYGNGWSPLFVFEATTSQVGVYRIQQQTIGASSQPRFELLEMRSLAREATPPGAP